MRAVWQSDDGAKIRDAWVGGCSGVASSGPALVWLAPGMGVLGNTRFWRDLQKILGIFEILE